MINLNAWRLADIEWLEKRDSNWVIYENWLLEEYSSNVDYSMERVLKGSKNFYKNGVIEGGDGYVGFEMALALFPDISFSDVRDLIDYYHNKMNRHIYGSFGLYYLHYHRYYFLIKNKVLPDDFMSVLMKGFYGNNLNEAANILKFDVRTNCYLIFRELGPRLFAYFADGENETITTEVAHYMLPFYLETLVLLTDEEEKKSDLVYRQHIKIKSRNYDTGEVKDPVRVKFMERLLAGIRERKDNMGGYMKEKLSPLF